MCVGVWVFRVFMFISIFPSQTNISFSQISKEEKLYSILYSIIYCIYFIKFIKIHIFFSVGSLWVASSVMFFGGKGH